ncbi:unnamed protein product [Brassica napus]|uniref:(rape) hypothetical protein n=1 Tax=Brassica napus TaxID=3708 RepID=A0A816QIB6_BRANA|nr:unnamed protein product [Brassica napus]
MLSYYNHCKVLINFFSESIMLTVVMGGRKLRMKWLR